MISGSCQQAALLSAPGLWWAHRAYLCLSRRRAGSELHIPVSCHRGIKRNLNRPSSPNVPSQPFHSQRSCWFPWECSAAQTQVCEHCPCPCRELGKEQQGRWPWHRSGPSPFLPRAHLLPQPAFNRFPPPSCALQLCPAPNQYEDEWTGGNRGWLPLQEGGGSNAAWSFVHPKPRLQELSEPDSCTWRHRRCKEGCKSGALVSCCICSSGLPSEKGVQSEQGVRLFCKDANIFIFNHFFWKEK